MHFLQRQKYKHFCSVNSFLVDGALFRTLIMFTCYHASDITVQLIIIVFLFLISAVFMT